MQFFHLGDVYNNANPIASNPSIPTLDQYETKLKYTKIRLYKDYSYVSMFRNIVSTGIGSIGGGIGPTNWTITDTAAGGIFTTIDRLVLHQIRIK